MTAPRASPSSLPIAYVRTHLADATTQHRAVVFCTRRGESVGLDTCSHCPRFLRISSDQTSEAVLCGAGSEAQEAPSDERRLSLPRLAITALMTRNIVCVRPDLSLDAAAALFIETGLSAVPVVDAQAKLIGFVSESDIMLAAQVSPSGSSGVPHTVGDIMLPYALALPETTSITRAAAVMAFEGQHRVAVVARDGQVVGVLSASDIMYWLARADGHMLPRPG